LKSNEVKGSETIIIFAVLEVYYVNKKAEKQKRNQRKLKKTKRKQKKAKESKRKQKKAKGGKGNKRK